MDDIRARLRAGTYISDTDALDELMSLAPGAQARRDITKKATQMVETLRQDADPSMMELFLGEYGLSSDEGIALMCLAEALLRVPDAPTMDALIEDKIAPSEWGKHLGESHSTLVNASTWALFVTGRVLDEPGTGVAGVLRGAIKRLGEPVIRQAVGRVMREMGQQFVLGETIQKALKRAKTLEGQGYTYSYDMLGEAAMTDRDAKAYHMAYADAIAQIAKSAGGDDIRDNPGISIKLSALHPRYDQLHHDQVIRDLLPRARSLAVLAKSAGIGLNIDAEEAARLDISLDVIEGLLMDDTFAGWDGFGVVVQAYGKRAGHAIDWLYALAEKLDRKIMIRLVKGAYWDTEIKLAQVEGLPGFPVFGAKHNTDMAYICCAAKLLDGADRIYPQFATHNAHTIAAVLHLAQERGNPPFEFQRLHGMGEALHDQVLKAQGTRCRIYAPVGHHEDLLAYLVRRLLENGANSSFVNQIFDEDVPSELVAADPFEKLGQPGPDIAAPSQLFAPTRINSTGFDLYDPVTLDALKPSATPPIYTLGKGGTETAVHNPATGDLVGHVHFHNAVNAAAIAKKAVIWGADVKTRAKILRRAADLYEENAGPIFDLLRREAGKTLLDCVGELREAVDFLRFYADEAERLNPSPAGIFTCISPWNFPLAIFTGQIAAALAAGNGVLAKPAESTSLMAHFATDLLHQAGVPNDVLNLIPGRGAEVGTALTAAPNIAGVCFTGSTATAQRINQNMAAHLPSHVPLIAETGGLNAMIVDSTALPEQAVRDVVASAFQSAGQRCSALRVLYLQEDIADSFSKMLFGAMDALVVGNPTDFSTDVGPVIDAAAKEKIDLHISQGVILKQVAAPLPGTFVAPTVLKSGSILDLEEEIFGPVLHLVTFKSGEIDQVISDINATGYGLTFGLHSRIDERVQQVVDQVNVGNLYINRNQIGAVVGSQPFGGHGLSGTGPKAGGPRYLARFANQDLGQSDYEDDTKLSLQDIENAFEYINIVVPESPVIDLPGPTGESNRYSLHPRGRVLCMGPGAALAAKQVLEARALGCNAIGANVDVKELIKIRDLDAVVYFKPAPEIRAALAARPGALVPLLQDQDFATWLQVERSVCIDTTAAGGNAALLGGE